MLNFTRWLDSFISGCTSLHMRLLVVPQLQALHAGAWPRAPVEVMYSFTRTVSLFFHVNSHWYAMPRVLISLVVQNGDFLILALILSYKLK